MYIAIFCFSSCFRGGYSKKNFFTGKVWGLCKERFGTFFNEANWSKVDKHFVQSYWSAYRQKKSIKILRSPIGKLCNLSLQRKANPTGFLVRGLPQASHGDSLSRSRSDWLSTISYLNCKFSYFIIHVLPSPTRPERWQSELNFWYNENFFLLSSEYKVFLLGLGLGENTTISVKSIAKLDSGNSSICFTLKRSLLHVLTQFANHDGG